MKVLTRLATLALVPLVVQGTEARRAPKVTTFLMFEGQKAEEAMDFYVSLVPGSKVLEIERYGPGGPAPEGSVKLATFSLAGQEYRCSDTYLDHAFTFTPSMSLFVTCDTEAEIDALTAKLAEGGQFSMPLGSYGFSKKFAWLQDRFGVSWQINLP